MKWYTDFIGGMILGMGMPTAEAGTKYMDWERAEKICLENPNSVVRAGLREDWNNTSGIIYNKGRWCDGGDLYALSRWATPIVDVDDIEEIECFNHEKKGSKIPKWWGRGEELESGFKWDFEEDE